MITEKQANSVRDVLIKAIEDRVEGMDTPRLLSLATFLNVFDPNQVKAEHSRAQPILGHPSASEDRYSGEALWIAVSKSITKDFAAEHTGSPNLDWDLSVLIDLLRRENSVATDNNVLQGGGIGQVVSEEEGSKRLSAIAVEDESADWLDSETLGAGKLAEHLAISRGTLDNWRKAKKIIALRKGLRNFVYPLRQFEQRRPVEGLDRIAKHFVSPEEAWEWLVSTNRLTGDKPPIEALRDGNIEQVARAAEGALDCA